MWQPSISVSLPSTAIPWPLVNPMLTLTMETRVTFEASTASDFAYRMDMSRSSTSCTEVRLTTVAFKLM